MSEERNKLASSGDQPTLIEPKEEPLDDISLMADDDEITSQSELILKDPKEEPFDSFPIENENFHQYYMEENECKKEELLEDEEYFRPPSPFLMKDEPVDEYTQDLVRLGLILPRDAMLDQSARWNSSSAVVNVKEEVDSDGEPQLFMDGFKDESILMENDKNIYLLCSCGVHVMSTTHAGNHTKECAGCKFNLDGKVLDRFNQGSIQCVMCDKFPNTAYGYADHLINRHSSNLIANGIYLRCVCGMNVCSNRRDPNHSVDCDGRDFSLHKLDSTIHSNPQCAFCEVIPSTVYGYAAHLRNIHKSTLKTNGIYLLCSCGSEVRSSTRNVNHNADCAGCEYTVRVEKIQPNSNQGSVMGKKIQLNSNQGSVKCLFCDNFPTTAYSYARHIYRVHKSTLIAIGIYLRCACGVEVRSKWNPSHNEDCDGIDFTLHKLEDEIQSTPSTSHCAPNDGAIHKLEMTIHSNPQCLLCDTIPSTAYGYADHLNNIHKSSLKASEIYLLCSCGSEVRSMKRILNHEDCAGCEFTVHELDARGNELKKKVTPSTSRFAPNQGTIQCVQCEAYPSSAYAYASHLKDTHKKTLTSHGIYLLCVCGHEIHSHNRSPKHNKECDARNFTLHKAGEK